MGELSLEEKMLQAYETQQIRNLMGRYEYFHTAKMHRETKKLFALKTGGAFIDNSSLGRYDGEDGIERFFVKFHEEMDGDKKGSLCIHTLTTEVIEIARDGQTAKGLWFSPGLETRKSQKTGSLEAYWVWGKYYVEFIKEDGEWKFWHFYITDSMQCEYHRSWIEDEKVKGDVLTNPAIPKADGPSEFPDTAFDSERVERLVPPVPEPYDTY
jgi:hypothetical protein